jgi:hypothetical protein
LLLPEYCIPDGVGTVAALSMSADGAFMTGSDFLADPALQRRKAAQ